MNYEFGFWVMIVAFCIELFAIAIFERIAYRRGWDAAMDRAIAEAEAVLAEKIKKEISEKRNVGKRQVQNDN